MVAPDLIGCGTAGPWSGTHAFTASDEAARIVDIIDAAEAPVHLVGHSYGGGVALRVARERPTRIASLTLYEPVAFHLLKTAGPDGHAAFEEIMALAGRIDRAVLCGAFFAAAEMFIEHWNGAGSWAAMDPNAQSLVARYIPKACLEFRAMAQEPTSVGAYRRFNFPTLLMVGEHTTEPVRIIARQLAKAMKFCSLRTVFGAGHMGPFTHGDDRQRDDRRSRVACRTGHGRDGGHAAHRSAWRREGGSRCSYPSWSPFRSSARTCSCSRPRCCMPSLT